MAGDLRATFDADFSSFYDAVQQATVELRSFEQGAAKVEDRLTSMSNRFSGQKVIQDAQLMAEAIERLGGVSTLTEQELARVGRVANEAVEKMRALGMDVPKGMQELADATKGTGEATESLGVSVGNLAASYITAEAAIKLVETAYHALVSSIEAVIASASDAEEVDAALLAALTAQGNAVPSVVDAYDQYAQALQRTTVYSDDAVKGAERVLAQIGNVMPRDMERALEATTNLAAGLRIDLSEAAMMVAKAAEGQTSALKRAGVVMEETDGQAADFGSVLDQLNTKFAGAAEAAGNTFAGSLAKLENAWDNVLEATGRVIVSNDTWQAAIAGLTAIIAGNTKELNANATANNVVSEAVILVVKGLSLAVEGIDYFQKELRDARVGVDYFAAGLTVMYLGLQKIEEATQTPLAWAGSEAAAQRVREAGEAIEWAHGQLNELKADIDGTKASSDQWSERLGALRTELDTLGANLEGTVGQTHALTAAQAESAETWTRKTEAVNADSEAMKANVKAAADVQKAIDETAKAVIDAGKESEAAFAILDKFIDHYKKIGGASRETAQQQIDDMRAVAEATKAALAGMGQAGSEAYNQIGAAADEAAHHITEETLKADTLTRDYYDQMAKRAEAAYNFALANSEHYTNEALIHLQDVSIAAQQTLDHWEDAANAALGSVGNSATGTAGAINGITGALNASTDAATSFADQMDAALHLTQEWITTNVPGAGGGVLGSWFTVRAEGFGSAAAVNKSYGGGMASGGSVTAHTTYLVGEKGPEFFVPPTNGTIVPNGGGGTFRTGGEVHLTIAPGAFTMNYPIMNNPAALDQLARTVGDAIIGKLTRAGARL